MEMRFGVELEGYGIGCGAAADALVRAGLSARYVGYTHARSSSWKIVTDGSLMTPRGGVLRGAFEAVSPVLVGEDGLRTAMKAADALREAGAKVNAACGLHVHFDAREMTLPQIARVMALMTKYEPAIDKLVAHGRRGDSNRYLHSTRTYVFSAAALRLNKSVDELTTHEALRVVLANYGSLNVLAANTDHMDRYRKVNLQSYFRHGTIEFRQHQGTFDSSKLRAWVLLLWGIVQAACNAKTIHAAGDGKIENLIAFAPKEERGYLWQRVALLSEQDDPELVKPARRTRRAVGATTDG